MKKLIYLSLSLILLSCQSKSPQNSGYLELSGQTMGTSYSINYQDSLGRNFGPAIDSLLGAINAEVSTYIPSSTISQWNQSEEGIKIDERPHFLRNYLLAKQVFQESEAWLDPSLMPLVNYWGFGYAQKRPVLAVDSQKVDSLRALCAFAQLELDKGYLYKNKAGNELDFSALAKGDAVDELGRYLESQGVRNYMVEIGGELRLRGHQEGAQGWYIGINLPKTEAGLKEIQNIVEMKDYSLATSGNYRNFYEVEGQKYAHTINPKTGYPEKSQLLSASIFAPNCGRADAWATACMAMGLQRAQKLLPQQKNLEAHLIYVDSLGQLQSWSTPKAKTWIKK